MALIFRFRYGVMLLYSQKGKSNTSIVSRRLRDAIKAARPNVLSSYISLLTEKDQPDFAEIAELFTDDTYLVPVPRRVPLSSPDSLWPPFEIAKVLLSFGLGAEILPILKRIKAVPKSAFSAAKDRPKVSTHCDSMSVESQLIIPKRIMLVDDFVTKGSTMAASYIRLKEVFPDATIQGFAVMQANFDKYKDVVDILFPCVDEIRYHDSGLTYRENCQSKDSQPPGKQGSLF